jgi:hypothetical protein
MFYRKKLRHAVLSANSDGVKIDVVKEFMKKGYGWTLPTHYHGLPAVLDALFRKYHEFRWAEA